MSIKGRFSYGKNKTSDQKKQVVIVARHRQNFWKFLGLLKPNNVETFIQRIKFLIIFFFQVMNDRLSDIDLDALLNSSQTDFWNDKENVEHNNITNNNVQVGDIIDIANIDKTVATSDIIILTLQDHKNENFYYETRITAYR